MKTRVISAAVGILLFFTVLYVSLYFAPILLIALAALNVIAIYEFLRNTSLCKCLPQIFIALIFGAIMPFTFCYGSTLTNIVIICLFAFSIILTSIIYHNLIDMQSLFSTLTAPIMLSFAFVSIYKLFTVPDTKHLFFILIFAFSWGADSGAYFGGTFFGKHKLAPTVSPKKTVEGAAFGILGSVLVTVIVCCIYSSALAVNIKWVTLNSCAIVFAVVGMIGDLFASLIKRSCGIKDYGNLMPGHGGVLDRFDSVLLISPLFYLILRILKIA